MKKVALFSTVFAVLAMLTSSFAMADDMDHGKMHKKHHKHVCGKGWHRKNHRCVH